MSVQRKKIGLVLPSSNTTTEPDFFRVMPRDMSLHTHRIWLEDTTLEDLDQMNADAEQAARYIGTANVDVIAYACTSGSFLGGPGYDQDLLAKLTQESGGAPAVGTSPAMIEALKTLRIRRVSVVTPYVDAINEKLAAFLEAHDLEVVSIAGQQIVPNTEIGAQTPEDILAFAKEHLDDSADGYFLSCTNWRAMEVADLLEFEGRKPVVTSNQATIWATFKALGVRDPIRGSGLLMTDLRS